MSSTLKVELFSENSRKRNASEPQTFAALKFKIVKKSAKNIVYNTASSSTLPILLCATMGIVAILATG